MAFTADDSTAFRKSHTKLSSAMGWLLQTGRVLPWKPPMQMGSSTSSTHRLSASDNVSIGPFIPDGRGRCHCPSSSNTTSPRVVSHPFHAEPHLNFKEQRCIQLQRKA